MNGVRRCPRHGISRQRRRQSRSLPISAHISRNSWTRQDAPDREKKLRDFCQQFAERAFRRPLTTEQATFIVDRQFKDAKNPEMAVKRVILLVLKSPRFLYREIGSGHPDGYDVASRLSFGLWDSLPDQILLDSAATGQLATREQVVAQAERMVRDPRWSLKVREFFLQWLKVDQVPDIAKDPKQYPQFNELIVTDLRSSLELFLDDIIGSETADFRQLLRADYVYLNGRLSQFYGAELSADAPFQKVYLDRRERAGVLTHPYLMSSFAYTAGSSPIHRGVFVAERPGSYIAATARGNAPLAPDLHPDLTTRERVTLQTKAESCQSCHGMINSLGFTLEHFDAVGRYRNGEKGRPIDANGLYETRSGEVVKFDGVSSLAAFLAASEETHTAIVQQLFHHLVKQPVRAFGSKTLPNLRRFFASHDFSLRKLAVEIMATSALTARGTKRKIEWGKGDRVPAESAHRILER